jgi:hypothetical protein
MSKRALTVGLEVMEECDPEGIEASLSRDAGNTKASGNMHSTKALGGQVRCSTEGCGVLYGWERSLMSMTMPISSDLTDASLFSPILSCEMPYAAEEMIGVTVWVGKGSSTVWVARAAVS